MKLTMLTILFAVVFALLVISTIFVPGAAVVILLVMATLETGEIHTFGMHVDITIWMQVVFIVTNVLRWWLTLEEVDWELVFPVLAVGAAALMSVPFSIHPAAAFRSASMIVLHVLTFYCIAYIVKTSSAKQRILVVVPVLIVLFGFWSVIQVLVLSAEGPPRLHAGFLNWNVFAIVLTGLLPFLAVRVPSLHLTKPTFGAWLFLVLALGMIFGARSRSGLVLLGFVIIAMVIFGMIHRKVVFGMAAGLVMLMITATVIHLFGDDSLGERLARVVGNPRLQERSQNAVLALMGLVQHPFFGVGAGQWEAYGNWAYPDLTFDIQNEYSSFMTLLAETGFAGGLAFVYFFQSLFPSTGEKTVHEDDLRLRKAMRVSLWVWAAATVLYAVHLHPFTWCWLGLLCGLGSIPRANLEPSCEMNNI